MGLRSAIRSQDTTPFIGALSVILHGTCRGRSRAAGQAMKQSESVVAGMIVSVRGQRVILDSNLAAIYGVPTHRFNEAVKRNLRRFPGDFMFQVTREEFDNLISQNAISRGSGSRSGKRGVRTGPGPGPAGPRRLETPNRRRPARDQVDQAYSGRSGKGKSQI
jgi:hypothetical protein